MPPPTDTPTDDPLTAEGFAVATDVSRETIERLEAYVALLERWGRRINLVGRASMADVWRRHMLDSAQILPHLSADCRRLIDFGSGAGFPGLVLAILGVEGVELIESDGRKCAFLAEAARITGAAVTIHNMRIESLTPFPADVITARACAPLEKLLHYAEPFWASHTRLIALKGAHVDKELTEAAKYWNIDVERSPSLTDPHAAVLSIRHLQHDKNHPDHGHSRQAG
ncbi:MAG: 16S rRNA (guanine(527)-N(7))-methyltransferase RsmG [Proteobacteria bacterium]|nr:16S rRNA (guanine(527)-N(7))-methyltransferase RsmG [Pseudomonadota bacterium]